MKISAKVGKGFYKEYLRKRDNSKGQLTEVEFMSWLYTTQEICDEVHREGRTVGRYHVNQYYILKGFHELLTPREVRISKSVIYSNLKDNDYPADDKKIQNFKYLNTPSESTFDERNAEWEERCDNLTRQNEAKPEKKRLSDEQLSLTFPTAPKAEAVRILSPSEYKDVQDTMVRQVPSLNSTYIQFDVSEETQFVTYNASGSSYAIEGKALTNELQGFRPISLKKEVSAFLNLNQFCGTAEENFINWFKHKLMRKSE